jgi:hypothetical protein
MAGQAGRGVTAFCLSLSPVSITRERLRVEDAGAISAPAPQNPQPSLCSSILILFLDATCSGEAHPNSIPELRAEPQ